MKKVILSLSVILVAAMIFAFPSPKGAQVSGTIVDENGLPLPAVVVKINDNDKGVVTDLNGNFTIEVNDKDTALIVDPITAYEKTTIRINGSNTVTAKLIPLKEIPYVAYDDNENEVKNTAPLIPAIVPPTPSSVEKAEVADAMVYENVAPQAMKMGSVMPSSQYNTESYNAINENGFHAVKNDPLSTFSIDVDAASYSNVRRFINDGSLPPIDAVRTEEMINYFDYDYAQPSGDDPVNIITEVSNAPWNKQNKLVQVAVQGKVIPTENLPASNIVFLIDVSGSMGEPNKLPLLQSSFKMLTDQLRSKDKVAIVVYAGNSGLVLPSTSGNQKTTIKNAIDNLEAGGSTAGGEGIKLAYKVAMQNFIPGGNNRVILATDGDFNVGESSDAAMERLIEEKRKSGVFLTVLGYGMGNYKDSKMETLADKGNGNYAYIDNISEARKVLVNEFGGTLFTIAKDVKLQVEFNPNKVQAYRLIGYENRLLNNEDFNDDLKDAGDMGSGHTVTALYEVIPVGVKSSFVKSVDELRYQKPQNMNATTYTGSELMNVKLRYKTPDGAVSKLMQKPIADQSIAIEKTTDNFRFATSVAIFGMMLRNSEFKQNATWHQAIYLAQNALGQDKEGYRNEYLNLVKSAAALSKANSPSAYAQGYEE